MGSKRVKTGRNMEPRQRSSRSSDLAFLGRRHGHHECLAGTSIINSTSAEKWRKHMKNNPLLSLANIFSYFARYFLSVKLSHCGSQYLVWWDLSSRQGEQTERSGPSNHFPLSAPTVPTPLLIPRHFAPRKNALITVMGVNGGQFWALYFVKV